MQPPALTTAADFTAFRETNGLPGKFPTPVSSRLLVLMCDDIFGSESKRIASILSDEFCGKSIIQQEKNNLIWGLHLFDKK